MLFPHPSASKAASGFMLVTRCLPRGSDELASMTATLGSFYWLGFETSGLSPDKKRLAWLGAQRLSGDTGEIKLRFDEGRYRRLPPTACSHVDLGMTRPAIGQRRRNSPI